jgi:hypothetical protein
MRATGCRVACRSHGHPSILAGPNKRREYLYGSHVWQSLFRSARAKLAKFCDLGLMSSRIPRAASGKRELQVRSEKRGRKHCRGSRKPANEQPFNQRSRPSFAVKVRRGLPGHGRPQQPKALPIVVPNRKTGRASSLCAVKKSLEGDIPTRLELRQPQ